MMYYQVVTEHDNIVVSSRIGFELAKISLRFVRDHMQKPARLEKVVCQDDGSTEATVVIPHDQEI